MENQWTLRCQPRQSVWSEWFGVRGPADRTARDRNVFLAGFSGGISACDSQGKRWGLAFALAFLANVHLNRFRTYQFRPLEGIVEFTFFWGCCLMKPSRRETPCADVWCCTPPRSWGFMYAREAFRELGLEQTFSFNSWTWIILTIFWVKTLHFQLVTSEVFRADFTMRWHPNGWPMLVYWHGNTWRNGEFQPPRISWPDSESQVRDVWKFLVVIVGCDFFVEAMLELQCCMHLWHPPRFFLTSCN